MLINVNFKATGHNSIQIPMDLPVTTEAAIKVYMIGLMATLLADLKANNN